MTTRLDDGISVLGKDYEQDVLEIERQYQSEKVTKSDIEEIITRSTENVELEEKSFTELVQTLETLDKIKLLEIVKRLSEDGEVSEDALSKAINYQVNAMTDRSEEIEKNENMGYPPKKDKKEKKEDKEKEEKSTVENTEVVEKTEVSPEILELVNSVNELKQSLAGLGSRLGELEKLQPANEESKTPVEENKSVVTEENQPVYKNILSTVGDLLAQAIEKTGEERKSALQETLQVFGTELFNLNQVLESQAVEQLQTEVVPEELKSFVEKISKIEQNQQKVDSQLGTLGSQMADVVKALNSLVSANVQNKPKVTRTQEQTPVSKSIVPTQQPVLPNTPVNPRGLTIREAAIRSTMGNLK